MPLTISLYSRKTPDAKIVKEPAIIVNFPFSAVFPVGLRKYGGGQLANLPMPPTRGARFGSLSRSAACTGCGPSSSRRSSSSPGPRTISMNAFATPAPGCSVGRRRSSRTSMRGRVRLSSDVSEIRLVFSIPPHRPTPNFPPSWNAAPTDQLPIVRFDVRAGERSLDLARWSLVPYCAKAGFANINAKAEGIAHQPKRHPPHTRNAPGSVTSTLQRGVISILRLHAQAAYRTFWKAPGAVVDRAAGRPLHRQPPAAIVCGPADRTVGLDGVDAA